MICIKCFHGKTHVTNSRQNKRYPTTWRRHMCDQCGYSFTTYEKPVISLVVISQDGEKNNFSIGKLILSIARSFNHNEKLAGSYSYDLANTIQDKLIHLQNKPAISSQYIAEIVHSTLQNFDQIAALQYAAQHNLIVSQRKRYRGRPSFSYSEHDSDHSSLQ